MEYFCAGYVVVKRMRKGLRFFPIKNGKVCEDKDLVFDVSGRFDYPVGWVLDIQKTDSGRYSGFKYVGDGRFPELEKKYRIESAANAKQVDLERLRMRGKELSKILDNMTIAELKEYAQRSYVNRRALQYYLLELF